MCSGQGKAENLGRHNKNVKIVKFRTKEDENMEINEMVSVDLSKIGTPSDKIASDPNLKKPN